VSHVPKAHPERRPPKVVYIAGWNRSGSTILDQVLGSIPGWFSAGELGFVWHNLRCGCGIDVHDCGFWQPVIGEVLDAQQTDLENVLRERDRRSGTNPAILASIALERCRRAVGRAPGTFYPELLRDLYAAIATEADARVIVDSTKNATEAFLLSMLTDVELYVVHLVRDPRAIAYSWSRKKILIPPERYFRQIGPVQSSVAWLRRHAVIEALLRRRLRGRYLRLRYEDFVREPRAAVESISRLVGESDDALPFVSDHVARVAPNHTVGGNPSRFKTGDLALKPDDEWRATMTPRARLLATLPALPLLRRYGYSPQLKVSRQVSSAPAEGGSYVG
jgi:sulfotransferase family protein